MSTRIVLGAPPNTKHSINYGLATYDNGDQFDHNAALGFIKLWSLPLSTPAQAQLLPSIGIEGYLLKSGETKIQVVQDNQ